MTDLSIVQTALAEHGNMVKAFRTEVTEDREQMKAWKLQLGERLQEVEQKIAGGIDTRRGEIPAGLDAKLITETETFSKFRDKAIDKTERYNLGLSVKALVSNGNGDSPSNEFPTRPDRSGDIHYVGGLRQLRLLNLLPAIPVTSNKYEFTQLVSTGDADVQEYEGDEKAEMEFEGSLVDTPIATIAVHTTASMQVLDDSVQLAAMLDRIMQQKAMDKLERSLITGSGVGGNIDGLYTQSTAITVQSNTVADRIGEAQYKMQNAGYEPNVVLMNPADWFVINVIKNLQEDYVYGSPAVPRPNSLWGIPVITSPTIPLGTALIGDTNQTNFLDRMQPTVYMTRDYKDYATRNLVLILVELRAGLALYDTAAFRRINLGAQT